MQDFAEHAGGLESRHAGKIDRRFGVARAPKHSAILRAQRKDMAWLRQILRTGFWVRDHLDGRRPVMRADAGRHPARRVY